MTAEELQTARRLLRLSQSQMAKMLETDVRTLRRYERGEREIAVRIGRLAQAYLEGWRPKDWPERRHWGVRGTMQR